LTIGTPLENSNPVHLRSTKRSLPIALLRARETVMAPLRSMLAQSGINEQKWRVLRVLNELGPSEQTTIAEAACLLLPSLTRIMASMEKDGFIHRQTDTQDRRKTIVALQDAGRQLIKDHAAQSNLIMSQIEDSFGREKIDLLLNLLEELHQGVPAQNRP
jgi:homoprotocatechuate degradation regulator HpaR